MPPTPEPHAQAASHRRLGAHLLRQRTVLHFSQEALGEALGVSTKSI
jgi:hypothetical protein